MSPLVPVNAATSGQTPADPATRPLSGPRRLGLLLILLILPVIAVSLPAILVTLVFGQRPHPPAAATSDMSGLRQSLEQNAQGVLPPPAGLAAEPIILTVRSDHVAARAARVTALVERLGGSASEGLPKTGEKHLFIDLPATSVAAFRAEVVNTGAASPTAAPAAPGAPVSHLEVIVRAAADDE